LQVSVKWQGENVITNSWRFLQNRNRDSTYEKKNFIKKIYLLEKYYQRLYINYRFHDDIARSNPLIAIHDFSDFAELPCGAFWTSRNFRMWYIGDTGRILFPTEENSVQPRVFFAWKIPSWTVNAPRGSRHKISMETFEKLPLAFLALLPPPSRRHPKSVS